jgi:hypothetical protein
MRQAGCRHEDLGVAAGMAVQIPSYNDRHLCELSNDAGDADESASFCRSTGAPRVADPEDIMDNVADQDALSGTAASPVGNTLRFGIPATNGGSLGAPGPFLESPASRTVPSQQR